MSTKKRNYLKTLALKALFLPFFFPFFNSLAHAAEFGQLTVFSQQGHPLRARVELLSVSHQEAELLLVGLAPREAYRMSGLDYDQARARFSISLEGDGTRIFAIIRSDEPINEPHLSILLELSVQDRRIGREFFITLESAPRENLPFAPLSSAAIAQRNAIQRAMTVAERMALPESQRSDVFLEDAQDGKIRERVVVRGDTLSKIALSLGRSNASLEQMLVSLYRSNPDAFINKNMNLLREGAVLSIPDPDAAEQEISRSDARRVVRLHTASFRQYSLRLAGMVADAGPGKTAQPGPVAEGRVSARVSEKPTQVNQSPDRLELSKIRLDTATAGMTVEEKVAIHKEIEDAKRRITELEKNVAELRDLLTIISESGHALTRGAEAAKVPARETETAAAPEKIKTDGEASPDAEAKEKETAAEDEKTAEKADAEKTDQTKKTAKPVAEPVQPKVAEKADDKADKKPGLLSALKTNTTLHFVAGIILTLLVVSVTLLVRRRRSAKAALAPAPAAKRVMEPDSESPPARPETVQADEETELLSEEDQENSELLQLELPDDEEMDDGDASFEVDDSPQEPEEEEEEPAQWEDLDPPQWGSLDALDAQEDSEEDSEQEPEQYPEQVFDFEPEPDPVGGSVSDPEQEADPEEEEAAEEESENEILEQDEFVDQPDQMTDQDETGMLVADELVDEPADESLRERLASLQDVLNVDDVQFAPLEEDQEDADELMASLAEALQLDGSLLAPQEEELPEPQEEFIPEPQEEAPLEPQDEELPEPLEEDTADVEELLVSLGVDLRTEEERLEDEWNAAIEASLGIPQSAPGDDADEADFRAGRNLPGGMLDEDDIRRARTNNVSSLEPDLSDINLEMTPEFGDDIPEMRFSQEDMEEYNPFTAEMDDKLELAKAYADMRDKEGARELLEEIIERGTAQQVEQAQDVLRSL